MLNARALVSRAPCFRGEHSISSRVWSDISRLSQSRSSTTFIRISESRLHTFVLCIYPAGRSLLDSWLKDTMRLSGWKSIVAFLSFALLCAACTPEQNNPDGSKTGGDDSHSNAPAVTVGVDKLSAISAVLKGKANLPASVAADLKIGFQYSQSAGILPTNSTTVDAEDADADYNYTTGITGLDPETTYYFRSFVRQNGLDTYGETKSFTTKTLIETKDASDVEAAKARLNAMLDLTNVNFSGLSYGFYWGTSENSQDNFLSGGNIADNEFSAAMTNLSHKTQYWYKAYVKLDDQTFYGEVKTFTTDVIPVESVTLDKTEHSFNTIGNTLALMATVLPSDATDRGVEWSSDNADVATVDQNGVVTANGNGDAVITVTTKDQGKTATCAITVYTGFSAPEAVDLGIVVKGKNIKWGSCNLGATKPEEYGDYFAWGETYTNKLKYNWDTYRLCYYSKGDYHLYKYSNDISYGALDNKYYLETGPEGDDAASKLLGGKWRMPTDEEWGELLNRCTWTWVDNYDGTGIAGIIVTSKVNGYTDKSIFLPAAGDRGVTSGGGEGSSGSYWSSHLYYPPPTQAIYLYFTSRGRVSTTHHYRCYGFSVRPVSE